MRRKIVLLLLLWPTLASAHVTLTFYSRELGVYFPHAFVRVTGATDAAPDKPLDDNYGFTAKSITPAVLTGAVAGEIMAAPPGYVAHSDSHFSLELTDAQYAQLLALVEQWRNLPQPSYDLHHRNCVYFVGEVARTFGLTVDDSQKRLMSRPRSYIVNIVRLNPGVGTVTPGSREARSLAAKQR